MAQQEVDFYRKLRDKVRDWGGSEEGKTHKWAEYLLLAPDLFYLLCKLTVEPEIPNEQKVKLAAAIAYFISPIDLIPEAILGPVGYVDDIALAAYVLNDIINKTNPEIVQRHWAGDGEVLEVVRRILELADEMLGSGLWRKLKKVIK